MLDTSFKDLCLKTMPKMNPEIMKGYACHEFKELESRVSSVLKKAFDGMFNGALKYHGIERCTPQEEFDFTTRPKNTKRTFELAQSDIYLVKVLLTYAVLDKELPIPNVYLWLPFCRPGGLMFIGGPLYQLIPIVSDKVISPEEDHLFVRLEQYKMKFYRDESHAVVCGENRLFKKICWSNIYRQKTVAKTLNFSKAKSTLVHYLLCRHGLSGLFKHLVGIDPIIGSVNKLDFKNKSQEDFVIFKTAYDKTRPPTFYGTIYKPTELCIAIPKENINEFTEDLCVSVFYIVDNFSSQFSFESLDDPDIWRLTLGYILFSSSYTAGRILSLVDEHLLSSDTYMDDISIKKLKEKGYVVNNFYDLLALIVKNYTVLYGDGNTNRQIYGKYLDTLREVLYPITTSIFTTKYTLMKQAVKGLPAFNVVKDIFTRKFKPGPIFKLTSTGIVAEPVSYSGDHMYLKITSRLSLQETTPGVRATKSSKTLNENHYLNTSMMLTGSVLFLSKNKPVPLSHVNPFIKIDLETGTILEHANFKEELDEVDKLLNQKS